ncbi:MAG TPA: hypothetical protein VKU62_09585 [Thermoanaerobaculia bacterium]|nr:hypothetical protein [Thermoanaerobaculia bacterium]
MLELTEDRIPSSGIAETVEELIELYGGELQSSGDKQRRFVLPLRRGVPVAGGIECTVSWAAVPGDQATVTLVCDREVDAPKWQRVALLVVGVIASLLFMLWPFFGKADTKLGTLAIVAGFVAVSVYLITLRRTSGGIAHDFLQRLARRQRDTSTSGYNT